VINQAADLQDAQDLTVRFDASHVDPSVRVGVSLTGDQIRRFARAGRSDIDRDQV
jgi:hypothetical protein